MIQIFGSCSDAELNVFWIYILCANYTTNDEYERSTYMEKADKRYTNV